MDRYRCLRILGNGVLLAAVVATTIGWPRAPSAVCSPAGQWSAPLRSATDGRIDAGREPPPLLSPRSPAAVAPAIFRFDPPPLPAPPPDAPAPGPVVVTPAPDAVAPVSNLPALETAVQPPSHLGRSATVPASEEGFDVPDGRDPADTPAPVILAPVPLVQDPGPYPTQTNQRSEATLENESSDDEGLQRLPELDEAEEHPESPDQERDVGEPDRERPIALPPLPDTEMDIPGETPTEPPIEPLVETPTEASTETPADASLEPEPPRQSAAMAAVAGRAERLIRHAFALAERGAHYSARAELIQALRLVAQALDAERGTSDHSRALSAGLVALEEADDFAPPGSRLEADLDMADLVASHHTPVLKQALDREKPPTPLAALQHYFTFAQEQLATAAGREPAASTALYGLGKLQFELARSAAGTGSLVGPKAMVFHQAALTVDPQNYKAANELGVVLARYGQFAAARRVLIQSMRVSPQPATWHNLAVVHAQLGETELAARARYEEQLAVESARRRRTSDRQPGDQPPLVDWVDPKTFAESGAAGAELPHRAGPVATRTPAVAAPAASKQQGHAAAGWWPWSQSKR